MARPTKGDWDKAKALYEADKSLRQISDETRIDNSNIAKRAKKEEWQRGVLPKLIEDTARVREEFTALLAILELSILVSSEICRKDLSASYNAFALSKIKLKKITKKTIYSYIG